MQSESEFVVAMSDAMDALRIAAAARRRSYGYTTAPTTHEPGSPLPRAHLQAATSGSPSRDFPSPAFLSPAPLATPPPPPPPPPPTPGAATAQRSPYTRSAADWERQNVGDPRAEEVERVRMWLGEVDAADRARYEQQQHEQARSSAAALLESQGAQAMALREVRDSVSKLESSRHYGGGDQMRGHLGTALVSKLDQRASGLERRAEALEDGLPYVDNRIDAAEHKTLLLERRIKQLEETLEQLGKEQSGFHRETGRLNEHGIDTNAKVAALEASVTRLSGEIGELSARLGSLERSMAVGSNTMLSELELVSKQHTTFSQDLIAKHAAETQARLGAITAALSNGFKQHSQQMEAMGLALEAAKGDAASRASAVMQASLETQKASMGALRADLLLEVVSVMTSKMRDMMAATQVAQAAAAAATQQQVSELQQAATAAAADGGGAAGAPNGIMLGEAAAAGSTSNEPEVGSLVDVCSGLCRDLGLPGQAAGQSLVQQVDAACEIVGVDKGAGTLVERANQCRQLLYGGQMSKGGEAGSEAAASTPPRVEY